MPPGRSYDEIYRDFRWSVPAEAFSRMASQAGTIMSARERVGFLGNAEALLDSGSLRGEDYVKMLEAFASDPDPGGERLAVIAPGFGSGADHQLGRRVGHDAPGERRGAAILRSPAGGRNGRMTPHPLRHLP